MKEEDPWLVRPESIRILWIAFIAILAMTVLADFFVEHHGYFGIDGTFGFNAWFGFLSCVAMVVFAKLLGFLVKRPEDYYTDRDV